MPLVRLLKDAIQGSPVLRRAIHDPYLAVRFALPTAYRREWTARIADVLACPDLQDIPRVADAGVVRNGAQIMHNGLRVIAGGYYGYPMTRLLKLARGVHEPQEEKAFGVVLPFIPSGGVMIELGAYWAFYSMWFNQRVAGARNFVAEPLRNNLDIGRANFALNGMTASFHRAAAGRTSGADTICVDDFVTGHQIEFVHLLHADVQGYEHDVLLGSQRCFAENRIGYVFISSHSDTLHRQCLDFLAEHRMIILADATPVQSYSFDGLIVARSPTTAGLDRIAISKKGQRTE